MKTTLKIEELFMFIASIYFFSLYEYSWWVYPALILTPDIGFLGYVVNSRIGAITYNFLHHKGVAVVLFIGGILLASSPLQLAAIIIFGHSSLDRMLGYGLKYPEGFNYTHLGMIGKAGPG